MRTLEKPTKILLSLTVFMCLHSWLQAQFTLSAELRPRVEIRHGYFTLANAASETAAFTSQRSRLNFEYANKKYEIKMSLQDIRVWGDEAHLKDIPSTALHEAWGELHFNDKLSLRAGRQELVYDDHRILGNVDWAQQARSHDAAVLKFESNGWKVHLGGAYNNMSETIFKTSYTLNNYRALSFFWLNKTFKDKLNFSFTGVSDGFQENDTTTTLVYRRTLGPLFRYKSGPVQIGGTMYYQFGKTPSRKKINAWLLTFNLAYTIQKTTLGLGVDYVSGTDALDTGNKQFNSFNTLYATNHKFYGFMDYFLNLPAHTQNGGLTDMYVKAGIKFSRKVSFTTTAHYFLLSNNVVLPSNPSTALDKGLGTEVDAVLNYKVFPDVNLKAGWSVLMATSSMEMLKGGNKDESQYWGWVMLTFKPKFTSEDHPD